MDWAFFRTWRLMPDRPRALDISDIPNLSIKADGSVDNQFLVSTVNSIKDKLLQIATLIRGNRTHWGIHARKTLDASGNTVSKLTIASGEITATQSFHRLEVQSGSTDDLDTINGGAVGDILILMADDATEDIVIKDGTLIKCAGDFTLDHTEDKMILIKATLTEWHEIARSSNA